MGDRALGWLESTLVDELLLNGGDIGVYRVFQQQALHSAQLFALLAEAIPALGGDLVRQLPDTLRSPTLIAAY